MNLVLEACKKIYARLIKVKQNRIIFWDGTPNSGSNIKILYEYFKENYPEYESIYFTRNEYISNLRKYITLVASARVVVTSHGCSNLKSSQTYFEVWHGVPLKKMGYLRGDGKIAFADKYFSSSETYTTLINACFASQSDYLVTGFPRNDYFYSNNNISPEVLRKIGFTNNKNVVFMPTFRKGLGNLQSNLSRNANPFGFDNLSINEINEYLNENNINIIMKLHPIEEAFYIDSIKNLSNIKLITQKDLKDNNLDIYQLLNYSEALITDYSSVYFDYLLTKKPVFFLVNDIEQYEKNRGFLVEPIDFWMPGQKIKSFTEFKNELKEFSLGKDKYKDNREILCNIIHHYKDGQSCKRVSEELVKELEKDK